MTKQSVHIALLVCDTFMPEVVEKSGGYPEQYSLVFEQASKNKDLIVTWDTFDVVDAQEYPSLQDIKNKKYDAILVSGSKYDAHDNIPWILKLLKFLQTMQTDEYSDLVKLIGICFGHQIILRAAGGVTGRNEKGWEVGFTEIELNSAGKEFLNTDKAKLKLHLIHQDHVSVLPENFTCLAFTENITENQATVSNNGQCITFQGHPEVTRDTMRIWIEKVEEAGHFPVGLSSEWINTLDTADPEMDGVWLTEKIIDFISKAKVEPVSLCGKKIKASKI